VTNPASLPPSAYLLTLYAQAPIDVHFSPGGNPTAAIVKEITDAKKSVLVQAYSFTSAPIADALRQAHKRSVNVRVILDSSQRSERYTVATFLRNAGIQVWFDAKHGIAHNKVMVIDASIVAQDGMDFVAALNADGHNLSIGTIGCLDGQAINENSFYWGYVSVKMSTYMSI